MKLKQNYKILSVLTACLLFLAACGGGSGGTKTVKVWKLVKQEIPTGFADEARSITFEYDEYGNLTRQNHNNLDGNEERHVELTYDDKGVLLTYRQVGGRSFLAEFDVRGEVIHVEDNDYIITYEDGEIDSVKEKEILDKWLLQTRLNHVWTVKPNSNLVSKQKQRDGVVVALITYDQSEANKLSISRFDLPNDDVSDIQATYEYNQEGDEVLYRRDLDGESNSAGESFITHRHFFYSYDYDANGNLEFRTKTDLVNDEVITTHYTWEEQEFLVR